MKPASSQFIANLANFNTFWFADLVTITLLDGTILNYTDFDSNVKLSTTTFLSNGPRLIIPSAFSQKIGTEVDEAKIQLWATLSDVVNSQAILQSIGQGNFDGADVLIQRVLMPNPNDGSIPRPIKFDTSAGAVIVMHGTVADITNIDRSHAEFDVKSRKELLDIPFPYRVFQPACGWPLYGAGCTLLQSNFQVSGAVSGGSGVQLLFNTNLTQTNDYFDEGIIKFTSGQNNGVQRTVRLYLNTGGQVLLFLPLPYAPASGDTFLIARGCDKRLQTCQTNFGPAAVWQAGHAYTTGTLITDGTNTQIVTDPGTSGGSHPTWSTLVGGTTADGSGSLIWTNLGLGNSINWAGADLIPVAEASI